MKGYLSNPAATEQAFKDGWFHSGDLGVMHEDNYIELKDRSKDIIISGGENISSIEIENCLYAHPDIIEAAVVARPDQKWGESPCAFVSMAPGRTLTAQQVIDFCYQNLAHLQGAEACVFCSLPKTSPAKSRNSDCGTGAGTINKFSDFQSNRQIHHIGAGWPAVKKSLSLLQECP